MIGYIVFVFLIIVVFLIAIDTSYDKTEELNKNILKRFSGGVPKKRYM